MKPATFEIFLESIIKKYPEETKLILKPAVFSPESVNTEKINKNSRAFDYFKSEEIQETIEFDRAVLGLNAYHDALTNNMKSWNISEKNKLEIVNWVKKITSTEQQINEMSYSILFNDLGKINIIDELYTSIYKQSCADHDALYVGILKECPEKFPGLTSLGKEFKNNLLEGLNSGFNLGKAVQLECPKDAWESFDKISKEAKKLHMAHSFFDFLGVTGAINQKEYSKNIVNDNNIESFIKAQTSTFEEYVEYRTIKMEANNNELSLIRLACMARVFNKEKFLIIEE